MRFRDKKLLRSGSIHWLTHYHPRYPRSLVYMLQASEYGMHDYLAWYNRTKDFLHVEKRHTLVNTPKALILLVSTWVILSILYGSALGSLWLYSAPMRYIFFLVIILAAPSVLAYSILVPLLVIKGLQMPAQYVILKQTENILQNHKGIKIAIAGSFGKTSIREILKVVLSEGIRVAAPPSSYNTPLGISAFAKRLKGNEEVLLFEFGEYYPGDIRALCRVVKPRFGIITGVNEAHLQKFKHLERTAKTIFELAECLNGEPLYVNGESERARAHAPKHACLYTRLGAGNWKVEDPETDLSGTAFTLVKGQQRIRVKSRLLGLHHVGPLAAASDIASHMGLSPSAIQKGIANTKPFDHRLESHTDENGVVTLDDSYNGNPDGVRAVIAFLASLANHRRFYVTPGLVEMGERTEAVHKEIGVQLARAGIENVVLIKNSVTGYIEQGLKREGFAGKIMWFNDALSAFATLPHMTVKGDVVLLQNDWPDQYQ